VPASVAAGESEGRSPTDLDAVNTVAVRRAEDAFAAAIKLHERVRSNLGPAIVAAQAISDALKAGHKLLVFGNGGSAADAQHVAAELVGRFQRERAAMSAIALTVDTSILTAIGNDYSFKQVFARQIEALGNRGDVAMGISTSGESPNVVAALQTAKVKGLKTIALTGRDGGSVGRAAEIHVNVPDQNTQRVQEVHMTLLHVMCEVIEEDANA
jgi:D-sedoheptulose 7-phosphate isomerase